MRAAGIPHDPEPATAFRDILRHQLRIDEGVRKYPYKDTVGKLSIGIGRNLDDVGVRPDEMALMLDNDIQDAEFIARALLSKFEELTEVRKAVVCNMAFNLGHRLVGFKNTLRAINEGRYEDAARGMLASLWARQVGSRAARLARQMREG